MFLNVFKLLHIMFLKFFNKELIFKRIKINFYRRIDFLPLC